MRKTLLTVFTLAIILVGIGYAGVASAQRSPFDIQFPIPELGNCESFGECKTYCDDSSHARECSEWAERNGFAAPARPVVESGPGGCRGSECESFCDQPENRQVCLDFAEEHGLIDREEAVRARQAIDRGPGPQSGPGGCTTKESCDEFCKNPANGNTCIDFGIANGFITQEEAQRLKQLDVPRPRDSRARRRGPERPRRIEPPRPRGPQEPEFDEEKAKILIESQGGPLGCATFQACDEVCNNPANDKVCFDFAVQNGLIGGPDVEKIKQLMALEGPGGCRGRACEAFCDAPGHENECLEFARANGLIPEEEYQKVKKFIDIEGPGGCRGRECEAFCDAPGHDKECFEFARQNGLIDEDEAREIERFMTIVGPGGCKGRECESYCNDPSHGEECFEFAKQNDLIPPEEIQRIEELQQIQRRIEERSQVREQEEARFRNGENGGFRQGRPQMGDDGEFRFPPERGEGGGFPPFSPDDMHRFEEFRGDIPPEFEQFDRKPPFDSRAGEGGEFQGQFDAEFNREFNSEFRGEFERQFNAEFDQRRGDSEFDRPRDSQFGPPPQFEFDQGMPPEFIDSPDFRHMDGGFGELRFEGGLQGGAPGEGFDSAGFDLFVPQGETFTPQQSFEPRFNEGGEGGFIEPNFNNFAPSPSPQEGGDKVQPPPPPPQQNEPPVSLLDFVIQSAAVIIGPFLRL